MLYFSVTFISYIFLFVPIMAYCADTQMGSLQTDRQTHTQTPRQTDRHLDRQTDTKTHRQTGRQTIRGASQAKCAKKG